VLQHWGTEVCRQGFHDDIWIASLENKLRQSRDDVVISDCRFPNEIRAIRQQGGHVIRVVRGPEPDWYDWALAANSNQHWSMEDPAERLRRRGIHASETAWIGTHFDRVIANDSSLDSLYDQINGLVQDLRHATADLAA
jgi:hypothetical protein